MNFRDFVCETLLEQSRESFAQHIKNPAVNVQYSMYDYNDTTQQAKNLKRVWHQHADHQFFKSLIKIHWFNMMDENHIAWFFQGNSKNEVSAMGYLPNTEITSGWGRFGVVLDGYVTLAANNMDVLATGFAGGKDIDPKWKASGSPRRAGYFSPASSTNAMIFDKESFDVHRQEHNELIVDNWRVKNFVVLDFPAGRFEKLAKNYAKKHNVPLLRATNKQLVQVDLDDDV